MNFLTSLIVTSFLLPSVLACRRVEKVIVLTHDTDLVKYLNETNPTKNTTAEESRSKTPSTEDFDFDICSGDPERGHCDKEEDRIYYDTALEECVEFRACKGEGNNFDTKEDCVEKCENRAIFYELGDLEEELADLEEEQNGNDGYGELKDANEVQELEESLENLESEMEQPGSNSKETSSIRKKKRRSDDLMNILKKTK